MEWGEKRALFDESGTVRPNADASARAKFTRDYVVKQFWLSFVEDEFDLDNAIQTKAEFSYAIAVIDRIGGWEEEEREQEIWKVQDSQHVEAVNWVCDDTLDEHVWVSEQTISLQEANVLEALQYDREIPCLVQWRMLWFPAPISLNNELLNDGVILEK